jgi:hypothetical protein
MLSGGGADVFAFGDASGYDIVENFHVGSDVVAIQMGVNGTGANDAFDLAFYQTEAGSTVLDLGGGNMVELYGVQLADLSVDNFLFTSADAGNGGVVTLPVYDPGPTYPSIPVVDVPDNIPPPLGSDFGDLWGYYDAWYGAMGPSFVVI